MTFSFSLLFNKIFSQREWYEDSTVIVNSQGIIHNITQIGTGSFFTITKIVKPSGITHTTEEIEA